MIPEFAVNLHFWGLGGTINLGGREVSSAASFGADVAETVADQLNYDGGHQGRIGGYARREIDWAFQSNLAAGDINSLFKQLRAAQIREAASFQYELNSHRKQVQNAADVEQFLAGEETPVGPDGTKYKKVSTQAFQAWMKRQTRALYTQCFQFAFDVAEGQAPPSSSRSATRTPPSSSSATSPARRACWPARRCSPRTSAGWRSPTSTSTAASTS